MYAPEPQTWSMHERERRRSMTVTSLVLEIPDNMTVTPPSPDSRCTTKERTRIRTIRWCEKDNSREPTYSKARSAVQLDILIYRGLRASCPFYGSSTVKILSTWDSLCGQGRGFYKWPSEVNLRACLGRTLGRGLFHSMTLPQTTD